MQKIVTLTLIVMLLAISYAVIFCQPDTKEYYYMTATAYSNHRNCIADKWRDGRTAMNTPIREGVVAINVRLINGEWVINSVLKLGQKIYVEDLRTYYSVEDTGTFSGHERRDRWTIDIYLDNYQEAKEWGRKLVKVYIVE